MNDPISSEVSTPSSETTKQHVTYLPPDAQAIKEYAERVCAQLQERDEGYIASEVGIGFAFFLEFAIERLCHYASNGRLTIYCPQDATNPNKK